jgi:hypothetical protein
VKEKLAEILRQRGKRLMLIGFLLFSIDFLVSTALVPFNLEETNIILFGIMALVGLLVSPALFVAGVVVHLYGRSKALSKSPIKHEWTSYEKTAITIATIAVIISAIGLLARAFKLF